MGEPDVEGCLKALQELKIDYDMFEHPTCHTVEVPPPPRPQLSSVLDRSSWEPSRPARSPQPGYARTCSSRTRRSPS